MKFEKKTISGILLIIVSILILIVPNILVNDSQGMLNLCLTIISKICLFLFLGLILLRLTQSFFWSYLILGTAYLLSSIIEISNIILLDHYITADNIVSLLNASKSEVQEFYHLFRIYLVVPAVLIAAFIFIVIKYKSIRYNFKNQKLIIPSALIALVISISVSFFKIYQSDKTLSGRDLIDYTLRFDYLMDHPFNLLNESYVFAKNSMRARKYKAQHDNFSFGILNQNDTLKTKLVVFIIGERMRYSNWSINGYNRETSPNLEKIKNLISFKKNYSNSNFTYGSIPLIITQATPKDPTLAYSQKTIVSLFKEAGYETNWISSQYLFDIVNEKKTPDHLYDLYKSQHTDMDIVPVFDSVLNKKTSKNRLIVINMLGGHGRVPAKFNLFNPNDSHEDHPVTLKNAPIFINTYDNMMLFQDYVLSEIVKITEKQNVSSVVMYTADHGCNLFDNGNALFGYGSANPTEKETHVPMFISVSDKYIGANNSKYKNLLDHKNLFTTNNNLFYSLADLANIKYKSFIKQQSISDSSFVESPSRFVRANSKVFEFKNVKGGELNSGLAENATTKENGTLKK